MRTVRRPWQTLGSRRHDVSIFLSWASRREKRGDWARCNTKTCQRPSLTPVICVVFSPYAHIMTAGVLAMGGCTAGVRRPTPPNAAGGLDLAGRPRSLASRAQTRSVPKCDLALAASVSGCRKGRSLPKLCFESQGQHNPWRSIRHIPFWEAGPYGKQLMARQLMNSRTGFMGEFWNSACNRPLAELLIR